MALYLALAAAPVAERQAITSEKIHAVLSDDDAVSSAAAQELYGVCAQLLDEVQTDGYAPGRDYMEPDGAFPPTPAALLVADHVRLRAYFRAFERAPETAETAVEIGTGPFAVLALGLAVIARKNIKQIDAWEVNATSAESARRAVELTGFSDIITIHTDDALEAKLPPADIGVTETFSTNLGFERGHLLVQAMARAGISYLIPHFAESLATDEAPRGPASTRPPRVFVSAGWIDLTTTDVMGGVFRSSYRSDRPGVRKVDARTILHDTAGAPILTVDDPNTLTQIGTLGSVYLDGPSQMVRYTYPLGANLNTEPAHIRATDE